MDFILIVLVRMLHILAGIAWTGVTVVAARVIAPVLMSQTTPSPWFAAVSKRIGPMAMGAGIVTVVTGIYLYAAMHRHDTSTGGIVLIVGALAGILAVPSGIMIGRTVRNLEAHLTGESGDAAQTAAARRRFALHARISMVLLLVSVVAMGTFRYVYQL